MRVGAGEFLPDQQTPERADHCCPLADRVTDGRSDLHLFGRAGGGEIRDGSGAPDQAAHYAQQVLTPVAVEIVAHFDRLAVHWKIEEVEIENESRGEHADRED